MFGFKEHKFAKDYQYDLISLDFAENYGSGDYRYVAYVTFDQNDWWFETINGTRIDNALYYILVQKFGYYFGGWFTQKYCADDDAMIVYHEGEGEAFKITGHYDNFDATLRTFNYAYYENSFADKTITSNSDKYGYRTTGDWIEKRETDTYRITLYAKWTNKTYTVRQFDSLRYTGGFFNFDDPSKDLDIYYGGTEYGSTETKFNISGGSTYASL